MMICRCVCFVVCSVVSNMVSRVSSSISIGRYLAPRWQDAYRQVAATAVLGLSILLIAGCAEHDATAYRADEAMPQPQASPVQENTQATVTNSGPMNLQPPDSTIIADVSGAPESPAPVQPASVRNDSSRLAFLEWFGSAADRARVNSPTDELRKSRDFTINQEQPSKATAQTPSPQQPFAISNNSRLVPTYKDGLPGVEQSIRTTASLDRGNADVTGSVSVPVKPVEATSDSNSVKPAAKNVQAPQSPVESNDQTAEQRQAATVPDPVGETPAALSLPDRNNPIRLHISRNVPGFSSQEKVVLTKLAALQVKTGLSIHIHGVARGISGDPRKSGERVRRLHRHAKRAIAVLAVNGVSRSRITITTAEQRITGIDLGSFSTADEDRLDFSLE